MDEQNDLAQHVSDRFVRRLKERRLAPDRAEALVWRMAENRARDYFRAAQRGRDAMDRFADELATQGSDPDPETLWLKRERKVWAERIVREVLASAPDNYRRAIERHWLNEESVEEMAEEYFRELVGEREVDAAEQAALRKRARNRVDQHLKRGRDWLRTRLSERLNEDEV